MELNTLAILMIAGSAVILVILLAWVYALLALSALRKNMTVLRTAVEANALALSTLGEAWNRSVALCDNCQRVFWLSEVGLTKTSGNQVLYYCQSCKDKG